MQAWASRKESGEGVAASSRVESDANNFANLVLQCPSPELCPPSTMAGGTSIPQGGRKAGKKLRAQAAFQGGRSGQAEYPSGSGSLRFKAPVICTHVCACTCVCVYMCVYTYTHTQNECPKYPHLILQSSTHSPTHLLPEIVYSHTHIKPNTRLPQGLCTVPSAWMLLPQTSTWLILSPPSGCG